MVHFTDDVRIKMLAENLEKTIDEANQIGWIPEEEILQELQLSAASTRPFSDIIEKYDEVSEYVNSTNEPIFLMKDGQVDLVVLSLETFANLSFYEDIAEIPPDTPCTSATL